MCCDNGAESNLISEAFARRVGIPIKPTAHSASQADGKSMLVPVGECYDVQLTRGPFTFDFDGIVIKDLCSDVIVGEPFLEKHDIAVRSAKKQIIIKGGKEIVYYDRASPVNSSVNRRVCAHLCRAPSTKTTVFPGEFMTIDAPDDFEDNDTVILEPRGDSQSITAGKWPNIQFTSVIGGQIKIANESDEPILLKKNDHFCQIRSTSVITPSLTKESESPKLSILLYPDLVAICLMK